MARAGRAVAGRFDGLRAQRVGLALAVGLGLVVGPTAAPAPTFAQAGVGPAESVLVTAGDRALSLVRADGTEVAELASGRFIAVRVATDGTVYALDLDGQRLVRYDPADGSVSDVATFPTWPHEFRATAECDDAGQFEYLSVYDFTLDERRGRMCAVLGDTFPPRAGAHASYTFDLARGRVRARVVRAAGCGVAPRARAPWCQPEDAVRPLPTDQPYRIGFDAGCATLTGPRGSLRFACAPEHVNFAVSPSGRYVALGTFDDAEHDAHFHMMLIDLQEGRAWPLVPGPMGPAPLQVGRDEDDHSTFGADAEVVGASRQAVFYDDTLLAVGHLIVTIGARVVALDRMTDVGDRLTRFTARPAAVPVPESTEPTARARRPTRAAAPAARRSGP